MRKQRFCDDKALFYRNVFALVLPMALQNLINVGITSADVIMLGKVGEIALSSSSLAGQIYFIMSLILFGLTSGAAVSLPSTGERRISRRLKRSLVYRCVSD